jgi:hypothetical protein
VPCCTTHHCNGQLAGCCGGILMWIEQAIQCSSQHSPTL